MPTVPGIITGTDRKFVCVTVIYTLCLFCAYVLSRPQRQLFTPHDHIAPYTLVKLSISYRILYRITTDACAIRNIFGSQHDALTCGSSL